MGFLSNKSYAPTPSAQEMGARANNDKLPASSAPAEKNYKYPYKSNTGQHNKENTQDLFAKTGTFSLNEGRKTIKELLEIAKKKKDFKFEKIPHQELSKYQKQARKEAMTTFLEWALAKKGKRNIDLNKMEQMNVFRKDIEKSLAPKELEKWRKSARHYPGDSWLTKSQRIKQTEQKINFAEQLFGKNPQQVPAPTRKKPQFQGFWKALLGKGNI